MGVNQGSKQDGETRAERKEAPKTNTEGEVSEGGDGQDRTEQGDPERGTREG